MQFSSDWFTAHIPNWERIIKPHCAGRAVRLLEVGSYEGRSACWTLQNLATHPDSRMICVDHWRHDHLLDRFRANVAETGAARKLTARHGEAQFVLRELAGPFDFIYLDADHRAHATLTLAVLAWPMLRRGGLLAFDDYRYELPATSGPGLPPQPGIDAFLACWSHEIEELHRGWQIIVRKR